MYLRTSPSTSWEKEGKPNSHNNGILVGPTKSKIFSSRTGEAKGRRSNKGAMMIRNWDWGEWQPECSTVAVPDQHHRPPQGLCPWPSVVFEKRCFQCAGRGERRCNTNHAEQANDSRMRRLRRLNRMLSYNWVSTEKKGIHCEIRDLRPHLLLQGQSRPAENQSAVFILKINELGCFLVWYVFEHCPWTVFLRGWIHWSARNFGLNEVLRVFPEAWGKCGIKIFDRDWSDHLHKKQYYT